MSNLESIPYQYFVNAFSDDQVWKPIVSDVDKAKFDTLIDKLESTRVSGTKKEKGDALEHLMRFIYARFDFVESIYHDRKTNDNQIDHIINFYDGGCPRFITQNIKNSIIGESKNHNKSISSREVSNLAELLRDKKSTLGIFSSYKSFSKGKNMWSYGEGKRRKLAIASDHIIIGFNIDDLKSLSHNNFYTMLKMKYQNIVEEIDDNASEVDKLSYHDTLYQTLKRMKTLELICEEDFEKVRTNIINRYGQVSEEV